MEPVIIHDRSHAVPVGPRHLRTKQEHIDDEDARQERSLLRAGSGPWTIWKTRPTWICYRPVPISRMNFQRPGNFAVCAIQSIFPTARPGVLPGAGARASLSRATVNFRASEMF